MYPTSSVNPLAFLSSYLNPSPIYYFWRWVLWSAQESMVILDDYIWSWSTISQKEKFQFMRLSSSKHIGSVHLWLLIYPWVFWTDGTPSSKMGLWDKQAWLRSHWVTCSLRTHGICELSFQISILNSIQSSYIVVSSKMCKKFDRPSTKYLPRCKLIATSYLFALWLPVS